MKRYFVDFAMGFTRVDTDATHDAGPMEPLATLQIQAIA